MSSVVEQVTDAGATGAMEETLALGVLKHFRADSGGLLAGHLG